jgi:hypothetical protein
MVKIRENIYKNTKKKPSFSHTDLSRKQESCCLYLLGLARQPRFFNPRLYFYVTSKIYIYIYIYNVWIIERKKLRIKLNKNIKSKKMSILLAI